MLTTSERDCPGSAEVTDGVTVTVGTPPPPWHWLQAVEFFPPELASAGAETAATSRAAAWRVFMGDGC
jgi:hypothetical protein